MPDVIIQRIQIEGGKEIEAALNSIEKSGTDAFKNIGQAAQSASAGGGVDALGKSTTSAAAAADSAGVKFTTLRGVMDTLGATSKEAASNVKGMSGAAASAVSGLKGLGDSSDQAGAAVGATDVAAIRLGQTLRLLGRAAGVRELSQLGRTVGVLGRAFEFAAPALFVAFLAKMASSASNAADKVADLAAKNKVNIADFQDFGAAFTGIGEGVDDAGKGFTSLTTVIKETATNTERNTKEFAKMADEITNARNKAADLADGFTKIDREATRSFRDIAQAQADLSRTSIKDANNFNQSLDKIRQTRNDLLRGTPISPEEQKRRQLAELDLQEQKLIEAEQEKVQKQRIESVKLAEKEADAVRKQQEETKKLIDQQDAEDKKVRDTTKALAEARAEAERNATVLEKMGINALDSTGKLKKAPEVIKDIANALASVTDADKRQTLENELVAAGIDRKLLPALRRGAEGFAALSREGKRVAPPFTPEQIQAADNFQIAIGKVESSIGALKNIIGLAVSPAFTAFFDKMTEIFVSLQPAAREFGQILGGLLKPVLEGLADAIKQVIDGLGSLFSSIAKFINSITGGNVTGVQVFAVVLGTLIVAFGGLPVAITLAAAAIGKLFDAIDKANFSPFTKNLIKIGVVVGALAILLAGPIIAAFTAVGTGFVAIGGAIGGTVRIVTTFGGVFARIMAVVGPLAVRVGAAILGSFGGIIGVVVRVVVAIASFIAGFLSIPVVIAIVVAAAIGFFAVWAFQNWDKITKFASDTWNSIKKGATDLWNATKGIFSRGVSAVASFFTETIPNAAKAAWEATKQGASDLWEGIKSLFQQGIDAVVGFFTDTLPQAAQSVWDTVKQGAADLWDKIKELFQRGVDAVANFFTKTIPDAGKAAWDTVSSSASSMWQTITQLFTDGVAAISNFFSKTIPEAVQAAWDFIKNGASDMWTAITGVFTNNINKLIELYQKLKDFAVGVWNAIKGAAESAQEAQDGASGGGGGSGFARGGPVWGPGTATSDSIPAYLSKGEFVHNARAVNYYGNNFMRAINEMRLPKDFVRGFNLGGLADRLQSLVPGAPLAFAAGGPVPGANGGGGLHPVTLDFGGGKVISGLQATDSVVKTLTRASVSRQVSSAGRKPSYFGRGK